jgi:SAM-dependent methyltransferase
MVAQFKAKAAAQGLAEQVEARVADFADLSSWPAGSFDGVVSAFAGLNTVPDLTPFAREAARLLRPEGRLVVHLLNRFSLWEWLGLVRDRRWAESARLKRRERRTFIVGQQPLQHYLFSAGEAYHRFFAPHFLLKERYGLGALRPPHTVRRIPAPLVDTLTLLEPWFCRRRPFLNWGRFFVLEMAPRQGNRP